MFQSDIFLLSAMFLSDYLQWSLLQALPVHRLRLLCVSRAVRHVCHGACALAGAPGLLL